MRESARHVIRFLMIFAVVAVLSLLLVGPAGPSLNPYVSALTDVLAGSDVIASNCEMKTCSTSVPVTCVNALRSHRCALHGNGTCTTTICP